MLGWPAGNQLKSANGRMPSSLQWPRPEKAWRSLQESHLLHVGHWSDFCNGEKSKTKSRKRFGSNNGWLAMWEPSSPTPRYSTPDIPLQISRSRDPMHASDCPCGVTARVSQSLSLHFWARGESECNRTDPHDEAGELGNLAELEKQRFLAPNTPNPASSTPLVLLGTLAMAKKHARGVLGCSVKPGLTGAPFSCQSRSFLDFPSS